MTVFISLSLSVNYMVCEGLDLHLDHNNYNRTPAVADDKRKLVLQGSWVQHGQRFVLPLKLRLVRVWSRSATR